MKRTLNDQSRRNLCWMSGRKEEEEEEEEEEGGEEGEEEEEEDKGKDCRACRAQRKQQKAAAAQELVAQEQRAVRRAELDKQGTNVRFTDNIKYKDREEMGDIAYVLGLPLENFDAMRASDVRKALDRHFTKKPWLRSDPRFSSLFIDIPSRSSTKRKFETVEDVHVAGTFDIKRASDVRKALDRHFTKKPWLRSDPRFSSLFTPSGSSSSTKRKFEAVEDVPVADEVCLSANPASTPTTSRAAPQLGPFIHVPSIPSSISSYWTPAPPPPSPSLQIQVPAHHYPVRYPRQHNVSPDAFEPFGQHPDSSAASSS
ncbi:hypothetical protein EUX98_g9208 [Antrodiella citrinella]|uniref:Uncharacterized protein n=1 Tax=Antrodiella citrinella TaxID=2447956 RepID=A0A4S4LYX1_9APHY|nr:hypothetical protein EUX98_g9208 [Antrodiella citrinella]